MLGLGAQADTTLRSCSVGSKYSTWSEFPLRAVCVRSVLFPFEEMESQRPRLSAGGCLDRDARPGRPVSSRCAPVPRPPLGSWARGRWQHVTHPGSQLWGPDRPPQTAPTCGPCFGFTGPRSRWENHQSREGALEGGDAGRPAGCTHGGPAAAVWAPLGSGSHPAPPSGPGPDPTPVHSVCRGKRSGLFRNSSCFLFIKRTHPRLQLVFPGSTAGLKKG